MFAERDGDAHDTRRSGVERAVYVQPMDGTDKELV